MAGGQELRGGHEGADGGGMTVKTEPVFPGNELRVFSKLGGAQPDGNILVNVDVDDHGEPQATCVVTLSSVQLRRLDVGQVRLYMTVTRDEPTCTLTVTKPVPDFDPTYDLLVVTTHGVTQTVKSRVTTMQVMMPNFLRAAGDDTVWRDAIYNLLDNAMYAMNQTTLQFTTYVVAADLEQVLHVYTDTWRAACKCVCALTQLMNGKR